MIIEKIEPLDKKRYKIFFDGSFAFVLYRGELARYQIEEGRELADSLIGEIRQMIARRARERALHLLQNSAKTESEIRRKLRSGWYPEEAVEETVRFLKEYQYLNDEEYVRSYIGQMGGTRSRIELTNKLRNKGIDPSLIDSFYEEFTPDEEAQIRRILLKRRYENQAPAEDKRRHAAYLIRKGFSYETVRRVMEYWDNDC